MEDLLQQNYPGHFGQPQVIPVPDELDPEIPRVIFGSQHGFSQIIVSQLALTLNVVYSPDWQVDISKGRQYLKGRVAILYALFAAMHPEQEAAYFCGLTTRVRLQSSTNDAATVGTLISRIIKNGDGDTTHDINLRRTFIVADRFFSNLTILNYRLWRTEQDSILIAKLRRDAAIERGIEIVGDFNDRYAFNERDGYVSAADVANEIIDNGLDKIQDAIERFQKG
ncbi:MAG: hypothetical protein ACU843_11835 [Gammaproteobacteria bacterium]